MARTGVKYHTNQVKQSSNARRATMVALEEQQTLS